MEDDDMPGQVTPASRARAKHAAPRQKDDYAEAPWSKQLLYDPAEDERLRRRIMICEECKGGTAKKKGQE